MCFSDPIHCSTCACNGCNRNNKEQRVIIPGKDAVALLVGLGYKSILSINLNV